MRETPTSSHSLLLHLSRRFFDADCKLLLRMRNLFAYISNDRSNSFSTSASPLPVSKDLREISFVPSLPPCLLVSLSAPGPGACQVLLTIVCESVSCYLSFSLRLFKEIVVVRRNWSRINGKERSVGFFLSISRTLANYEHYFSASLCVLFVFFSF